MRYFCYKNYVEKIFTNVPDDGFVGVADGITGVLLAVLPVDLVAVGPLVVIGTIVDVGVGDPLIVVIGVVSFPSSVPTYVTYPLFNLTLFTTYRCVGNYLCEIIIDILTYLDSNFDGIYAVLMRKS